MKIIRAGSDPEVFTTDMEGRLGTFVSESKRVEALSSHGGWNRDGLAFELNPAPGDAVTVAFNLNCLLKEGANFVQTKGLRFIDKLAVRLDDIQGYCPPDVAQIGCDPDYDAYTGERNKPPEDEPGYRFAGGHIMVQLDEAPRIEQVHKIVQYFDATAGLYSIRWSTDDSVKRRKVYGGPGCFRFKESKNIIEYRTPDAGWLWNNGFLAMMAMLEKGLEMFNQGKPINHVPLIKEAILSCQPQLAEELLAAQLQS